MIDGNDAMADRFTDGPEHPGPCAAQALCELLDISMCGQACEVIRAALRLARDKGAKAATERAAGICDAEQQECVVARDRLAGDDIRAVIGAKALLAKRIAREIRGEDRRD